MHGPDAGSTATVALPPSTGTTPAGDLVALHESIARLLAVQGNWKRAYSHLNAALRLARDAEVAPPIVPEQYRVQVAELRRAHAEAVDASLGDALTATYNRRYLDQRLAGLLAEHTATPGGQGIAVALVDLDLFKGINDAYGHLIGDRVLRQVVRLLQADLPAGSFCARYGGEEFVLVLPGLSAGAAVALADRVRRRVAEYPWPTLHSGVRVTVSIGLSHATAGQREFDADTQLNAADEALYAAKRAGRNAVGYRLGDAIRVAGLDDRGR